MAGYLGNIPVPQATQTRDRFVATEGQTSFPTSGYTAGYLDVYLNGVKLDSTDYTATNGSDVVLAAAAVAGDILEVVAYSTFEIGSNVDNASVATQSLTVDRQGSDGTIIDLRKDGTTVGSIGTINGLVSLGKENAGLLFNSDSNAIYPWNVSTNTGADALIDLGISSRRFKDLYLSGGVYIGGTGSANKLDDYEEGTWTPVYSSHSGFTGATAVTSHECRYVKIGKIVHLTGTLRFNSTATTIPVNGYIRVTGVPFPQEVMLSESVQSVGTCHIYTSLGGGENAWGHSVFSDPTTLWFYFPVITGTPTGSSPLSFTITYEVD